MAARKYYVAGVVILEPIEVNWVFSGPVINGMAAIRQTPMAAAIKPYSIAVAPDSSAKNFFIWKLRYYVQHLLTQGVGVVPSSREHGHNVTFRN